LPSYGTMTGQGKNIKLFCCVCWRLTVKIT
jgi:hypothetical protein